MAFLTARRSPARWFVPFALAVSLAMLFAREGNWIGVWSETSAAAQTPAILVSGIGAAAAAWAVGAVSRHGMLEQTVVAALPRWRRDLPAAAVTLFFFAMVSLVVQGVAFALTMRTDPPGLGMWPGYVLMDLVLTVLSVAFGHLVGKMLSGRFAAAVAGIAWFIVATYFGPRLQLTVMSGPVHEDVNGPTMVVRLFAAFALLALAVVVPALGSATRADVGGARAVLHRSRLLLVLSAVSTTMVLTASAMGNPISTRGPAGKALCQGGSRVAVCLWPEHEKYREMIVGIVARAERLPSEFVFSSRFDEYGLSFRLVPVGGSRDLAAAHRPYFVLSEGSVWAVAGPIAVETVKRSLAFCEGGSTIKGGQLNDQATELQDWLEVYLAGGGRPDYHTDASDERKAIALRAVNRANGPDLAEQLVWATTVIKDYNTAPCL